MALAPSSTAADAPSIPVTLGLGVATAYTDCTGRTPLDRRQIYRDYCLRGIYLIAHNPGPFTALRELTVGQRVRCGHHVYEIQSIKETTTAEPWGRAHLHAAGLTLQTCAVRDGSRVLVIDARADD